KRKFALGKTKPEFVIVVETHVEIGVADLAEVHRAGDGRTCKVGLDIDVHAFADLAEKHHADAAQEKTPVAAPTLVALFASQVGIGLEEPVVTQLGVPAYRKILEPL